MATHYLSLLANITTPAGRESPQLLSSMETGRLLRALRWIVYHLESHRDALAAGEAADRAAGMENCSDSDNDNAAQVWPTRGPGGRATGPRGRDL